MLTSDEHTDDLRAYLKSLTEAVDTAVTNRDVPASRGGRRRWPVVAGAAAAVLAVVGALVLSGMGDRQSVSTADNVDVDVRHGWHTVEYGNLAFDVPPGWVEQQPSHCDTRVNVRGYYLLPIRAEDPVRSGCGVLSEHWDTRDTLMLHLLPTESTYPVPSSADTIVTDGGLEGFAWNDGERYREYYFPEEHLRAGTYRSLEPEVDPASVVATLRPITPGRPGRPDRTTVALDGAVMRYPEPGSSEGEGAEVRGRLELDGDCLYVALDEVGERYPVVWPAGTTWDADSESVVSPSGARMRVGSEVYGGGGYRYVDDVGRILGAEAENRAGRCVDNTYGEIAFVNNSDDAIGPAQ